MSHTPTPYHVVTGRANSTVCAGAFAVAVGCKQADAEFIVRACNTHDELMSALQDALAYIMRAKPPGGYHAADKIIDALDKAKNADTAMQQLINAGVIAS